MMARESMDERDLAAVFHIVQELSEGSFTQQVAATIITQQSATIHCLQRDLERLRWAEEQSRRRAML